MSVTVSNRQVYRKRMPVVFWWVWLAFAVFSALDLAIQWHHRGSLVIVAILATGTGIAYACALRPRVIADDTGVSILNPMRDCAVPWGSVRAVDVGEAVQVHFSRPDGTEKVFPSWAMFSSSRAKLKSDIQAVKQANELANQSPAYAKLPDEARDMMARSDTDLVARQLDERAEMARTAGAQPGTPVIAWAWLPIAAMTLPAIALIALILT